ncbi:Coiled-coil domain-containing protein 6 [Cyanidiococcus yangmingshanensis]|uniref:Coiled-coil domain-containing protein 6 n=1 Tax=Cyanidiococcus yangmingshanensis TaxID=2690220 RepID=A0A7J7IDD8_9RHOD|nr:Coiled-coil domain-containing protein 6 [Cyanidiococcus yangmingshanensis]
MSAPFEAGAATSATQANAGGELLHESAPTDSIEATAALLDALSRVKQLEEELAGERRRRVALENEVQQLKAQNVHIQQQLEAEEEALTNRLNKRLNELRLEKEQLARDIEREEEYLTNTLQQRLEQLKKEKIDMENALEAEQEAIANRLQREVEKLQKEKAALEKQLSQYARSSLDLPPATPSDSESERDSARARRSFSRDSGRRISAAAFRARLEQSRMPGTASTSSQGTPPGTPPRPKERS